MIEGDEWKTGHCDAPTESDMVKYASQGARLLVSLPYYGHLITQEVRIIRTVNDGEYFEAYGGGFSSNWYRTDDVRVLAIMPPPVPPPVLPPKRKTRKKPTTAKAKLIS